MLCNGRYDLGKILSTGMIGVVFLVRDMMDPAQPFKCHKKMYFQKIAEKKIFASVMRELRILEQVSSIRGCIQLLDIVNEEGSLSLVTDFYKRGDLYHHWRVAKPQGSDMRVRVVQYICRQLVETLKQLHSLGIIHRDLKPENVLVDDNWRVVITDFGFAIHEAELKQDGIYSRVGTLEFYPPEMLSPLFSGHPRPVYDRRVDIWSLGVVVYELLYSRTPFYSNGNEEATKTKIRAMEVSFPNSSYPEAQDFFRRIFKHPHQRITIDQMLAHTWLAKAREL